MIVTCCCDRQMEVSNKKKKLAVRRRDESINDMSRRKQELDSKWSEIESVNRQIEKFEEKGVELQLKVWFIKYIIYPLNRYITTYAFYPDRLTSGYSDLFRICTAFIP